MVGILLAGLGVRSDGPDRRTRRLKAGSAFQMLARWHEASKTCAGANYSFSVATLNSFTYLPINQSINPSINIIYLFRKNSSAHILVDSDMCGFFQTATAVW